MTTTTEGILKAIGYIRVSTGEQADSGAGLAAQRDAIEAACRAKGWTLVGIEEDAGITGKALSGRPALASALGALKAGEANILVAAKLDRLSRSVLDFAVLIDRAKRERWSVVVLDVDVNMGTPTGELMATVVSAMAQYERRLIGQRTRDALAVKRAQGVRLGRPPKLDPDTVARIVEMRAEGFSTPAIARALEADGTPTATGGRWHSSTIQRVLASQTAKALAVARAI